MIEPRSVVHFSTAVSDREASRKFYIEIFGLTLVQAAPANGMVFLRAGNDQLILASAVRRFNAMPRTAAGRIMHSKSILKMLGNGVSPPVLPDQACPGPNYHRASRPC